MRYRCLLFVIAISVFISSGTPVSAAELVLPVPIVSTFLPVVSTSVGEARHTLPIGVQMFGATGAESAYFDALQGSQANWIRVPIHWREVEPVDSLPENYRWEFADQAVAAALDAEVNIIITHVSNPEWAASSPNGPIDRATLGQAAEYLMALMERYDGDGINDAPSSPVVEHFELYTKLDYSLSNLGAIHWGEVGHRYGTFLRAVYPAMKDANPNAQVIFGGIGHQFQANGTSILVDVLANEHADYFDMVALHIHPSLDRHHTPVNGGIGLLEKATAVRKLMEVYGVKKPLIITKTWLNASDLWGSQRGTYQTIQASYLVQVMVQSQATGIEATIWHKLYDPTGNPQDSGLVTPLVDGPMTNKPLMTAFQTLTQQLGHADYLSMIPSPPDSDTQTEMHVFEANGHRIIVAWVNPLGTNKTQTIAVNGSRAQVVDMLGEVVQVAQDEDDKLLQIEISGEPRYIHVWEE